MNPCECNLCEFNRSQRSHLSSIEIPNPDPEVKRLVQEIWDHQRIHLLEDKRLQVLHEELVAEAFCYGKLRPQTRKKIGETIYVVVLDYLERTK